jgi:predicted dehydrogenase
VLHALDPSPLSSISARLASGGDPVLVEAELASGLRASVSLSRVGVVKERRLRVVGSAGAAVFDDVRAPDRILVDDREIRVPWEEPLAREVEHFLRCVEERAKPRTPFDEALTVVRALARVEESCATGGHPALHAAPRP